MKLVVAKLQSITPYSPSRQYTPEVPKLKDESPDAYDARTWRHHAHVQAGKVVIPGECFAWAIKGAAKRRSDKIPGKRNQTFTKVFDSIEVIGDIVLNVEFDKMECEGFMANSDGVRGGGSRVYRRFPIIRKWSGELQYLSWDDQLTETVFTETLRDSGILVGVGRRRPENKGFFGRFKVLEVDWKDRVDMSAVFADA